MADVMRHRFWDHKPLHIGCASATVIEIGDAIMLDDDTIDPSGTASWLGLPTSVAGLWNVGGEGATQIDLKEIFLGISSEASASGETEDVSFGTDGVYELTLEAGGAGVGVAFHIGEYLTLGKDAGGNYLTTQAWQKTTEVQAALAKVVRERAANVGTTVLARLIPQRSNVGINIDT